jgi:ubiquinone/menaquinone biosynthesis C-methylase UbiE
MLDPNAEYIRLKATGAAGWGGQSCSRRRNGWVRTLARLQQDESFPKPPAPLLELGCGNGMVSTLFAQQGYEVEGIELSEAAIVWAREISANSEIKASFRHGDTRDMPFYADGQFQAVIDGNCLHCIIGSDRALCLAEVRRVLRPRGVFVVNTMCGDPKSADTITKFNAQTRCLVKKGQAYRTLLQPEEIAHEISTAGFDVIWEEISENAWWDHLTLVALAK